MTEYNADNAALRRLARLVQEAIGAQDEPVARRLRAAYEAGDTVLRTEPSVVGAVVVVVVGGHDLVEVDVRRLLAEEEG